MFERGETVNELRPSCTPALSFTRKVATFAATDAAPVAAKSTFWGQYIERTQTYAKGWQDRSGDAKHPFVAQSYLRPGFPHI